MHKISIVTVVLNRPIELERTICSCINQTYLNKEYIVIDGGSSKETIDIIKKYSNGITKWVSESDSGIFNAMNKSLRYVTGDYVIFMNAGDVFISSNTLYDIFNNREYTENIIYGDSILHNKYGYLYRKNASIYERKATQRDYIYIGQQICHQAMFTNTMILKEIKFNEKYKLGADYDTTAKIIQNNPNSYYNLKTPICIFDDVLGGASHYQLKKVIDERIDMFCGKKDLYYYMFLTKNYILLQIKDVISFLIPSLQKKYRTKKYKQSLEELDFH